MSIRPNFYGVNNIEDFKNIFGSKNYRLTQILFEEYEKNILSSYSEEWKDSAYQVSKEEDRNIIEKAVNEGGEALLDLEYYYPIIMFNLFLNQKETICTDSNNWRYYHEEFFINLLEKVEGKLKTLIEYFINGRKVFSEGKTDTEFPYDYLTLDEMKFILNDMNNNPDKYKDPENFDKDFKNWMEEFVANDKDLFFTQG